MGMPHFIGGRASEKHIIELECCQSSLDPTVYLHFRQVGLSGFIQVIQVEVDDIFTAGHDVHYSMLDYLRAKYNFAKFVFLDEGDGMFYSRKL